MKIETEHNDVSRIMEHIPQASRKDTTDMSNLIRGWIMSRYVTKVHIDSPKHNITSIKM